MSDISIPGISDSNSRIDTDSIIRDLIEVERIPINRLEQNIDEYNLQKEIWRDLGSKLNNLRESAKLLYSFQNPFNSRVATSSAPTALAATATREAEKSISSIVIDKIATRDKFASAPLPRDYRVAAGQYQFRVGEQEAAFSFSGGSVAQFVKAINENGENIVSARVVNSSVNEQIITFEAQETGALNRLQFFDDAQRFAIDAGIIERVPEVRHSLSTDTDGVRFSAQYAAQVTPSPHQLTVTAGGEAALPFAQSVETAGMVLQFEAKLEHLPTAPLEEYGEPYIPESASVSRGAIVIRNEPSRHVLPDIEAAIPQVVDNQNLLYAAHSRTITPLAPLNDSNDFVPVQIALDDYVENIDALNIRNLNTHRTLTIRNIELFDPSTLAGAQPLNSIEQAGDAEFRLDGVPIVRATNTVDDLIAGVTLTLQEPTSRPATLEVSPDYEEIKNTVIGFLSDYNVLSRELNILLRNESQVIDEISYFTDEEREEALERLGTFSGETTLQQLKSRLQTLMMNPYDTEAGRAINLLAQIGISTNATGANTGGVNPLRLRGYLEMDEEKFETTLRNNFQAVKELFGNDVDNDFVIDSGVALEVDRYTGIYTQAGGVVSTRGSGLDTRIDQSQAHIERYDTRLERYEQNLREEYGRMESALNSLNDATESIRNLNNGAR